MAKTSTCPLARVMRRELRARGISHLPVIYSLEEAKAPLITITDGKRAVPASIAFVPSVAGLMAAAEAIKTIIGKEDI